MNLTEYIKTFPRFERKTIRLHIAHALGISEVYMRSMCNGQRKIPGKKDKNWVRLASLHKI